MPRFRVDVNTTDDEIREAILNLFAASNVIDDELSAANITRSRAQVRRAARESIHDEIERLTNVVLIRRTYRAQTRVVTP